MATGDQSILADARQKGALATYPIPVGELLEPARKLYDDATKGGRPLPVLVDTSLARDDRNVYIRQTEDGKPYIIVSEVSHRWTPEIAHSHQLTDQQLAVFPRVKDPEVLAALEGHKLDHPLTLVQTPEGTPIEASGLAGGMHIQTQEGNKYVVFDHQLSTADKIAVLAHEKEHAKRNHSSPENIAAAHNDITGETSLTMERQADLAAAAACQGIPLSQYLAGKGNEVAAIETAAGVSGASKDPITAHDDTPERVKALEAAAAQEVAAGRCPPPIKPDHERMGALLQDQQLARESITGGQHVAENGPPNVGGGRGSAIALT